MLILSRKLNEQVVIGDQIVITVVSIRGGNVRLGIEAPRDVPVHRQEIYEALSKQAPETQPLGKKTGTSKSETGSGDQQ